MKLLETPPDLSPPVPTALATAVEELEAPTPTALVYVMHAFIACGYDSTELGCTYFHLAANVEVRLVGVFFVNLCSDLLLETSPIAGLLQPSGKRSALKERTSDQ